MPRLAILLQANDRYTAEQWPRQQAELEKRIQDFRLYIYRGPGHFRVLAEKLAQDQCELIVSLSNPQALNEIINGICRHPSSKCHIALHPEFHTGPLTDRVKTKTDFISFIERWLNGQTEVEHFDAIQIHYQGEFGQTEDRIFFYSSSVGLATQILQRLKTKKHAIEKWRFLSKLLPQLPFARPYPLKIEIDGTETTQRVITLFCANLAKSAHGFKMDPKSSAKDGKANVMLLKQSHLLGYLVAALPFYAGHFKKISFIDMIEAKSLKIKAIENQKVSLDFDGKHRGYLPAEFQVLPKAIPILR